MKILCIPKDAAQNDRVEKLEKAGFLVVVTDTPEKVMVLDSQNADFLIDKILEVVNNRNHPALKSEIRELVQEYREAKKTRKVNLAEHPCNPNRCFYQ
jgi:hypothetical protein